MSYTVSSLSERFPPQLAVWLTYTSYDRWALEDEGKNVTKNDEKI